MPLLALPPEILGLIFENLGAHDLWHLYDSCEALRAVSAWYLFRAVEIRFDGAYAAVLNSRPFPLSRPLSPSRLLPTVTRWSSHVWAIDVWGDEDFLQPEFFDVLTTLGNLRSFSISYPPSLGSFQTLLERLAALPSLRSLSVDFMSPRIWTVPMTFHHLRHLHLSCIEHEPGLCVLPSLPALETLALNFCCYCLDCPRNGRGPSALLQFHRLPQLRALSISGAQEHSVIWCGRATQVQTLEVTFSSGMDLSSLLACLGRDLEELYISDCEFVAEEPTPPVVFPVLRRVRILESLSSLASFRSVEVPLSAVFHVRIEPDDFEDLEDWPLVWGLLTQNPVSLSLAGSTILQSPLHPTSRLSQVASLPHVRLEGQNWPRPVVPAKAGAVT